MVQIDGDRKHELVRTGIQTDLRKVQSGGRISVPTIDQYDSPGRLDMMKSARASEQLRRGGRRAGSQVVVEFAFRYTGEQDRRTAC